MGGYGVRNERRVPKVPSEPAEAIPREMIPPQPGKNLPRKVLTIIIINRRGWRYNSLRFSNLFFRRLSQSNRIKWNPINSIQIQAHANPCFSAKPNRKSQIVYQRNDITSKVAKQVSKVPQSHTNHNTRNDSPKKRGNAQCQAKRQVEKPKSQKRQSHDASVSACHMTPNWPPHEKGNEQLIVGSGCR